MRSQLVRLLEKVIVKLQPAAELEDDVVPKLEPLTPRYDDEQHGLYYRLIDRALKQDNQVRNIALTGSYGVGKSSILSKVAEEHSSAVYVSLSTLGLSEDDADNQNDIKSSKSTTNVIQKEIVKQLLYSQQPESMPGSRYRRTTGFKFVRTVWSSTLLSLMLAVIFFWTGWTERLVSRLPGDIGLWGNLIVLAGLLVVVVAVRAFLHNRIQIDKITAGAATITLTNKSGTYFDDYLDEIVYFFERSKKTVIILEDIDRFDNAYIFETLRSLNTLLNGATQLKGRRIVFIYAIKDSIFDELGRKAARDEAGNSPDAEPARDAADAELTRANRTKFFDLVIPVVPFITHRSARDLLVQTMDDVEHDVSNDLIDLTARHVADMRLIKNIRNEFAIFKRQIVDRGSLELREDGLFAMVLYKSTHLTDFELIRFRKSQLDRLYDISRELINTNVRAQDIIVRRLRREIDSERPAASRSDRLGRQLWQYLERLKGHAGTGSFVPMLNGVELNEQQVLTVQFWEDLATTGAAISVSMNPSHPYGNQILLNISHADISEIVGDSLNSRQWASEHRAEKQEAIRQATQNRYFLMHADMSNLVDRPEFTVDFDGSAHSLSQVVDRLLGSELARTLLRQGYIDRNFTLYTSTYYSDRVSASATNYMLKNIDPDSVDMTVMLEGRDVADILHERGRSVLSQRAALNFSFVDYLLAENLAGARVVLEQMRNFGDDQRGFLLGYMEHGQQAAKAVTVLAEWWPHILVFLVEEAGLSADYRQRLLDNALMALKSIVDYEATNQVIDCIVDSFEALDVFVSDAAPSSAVEVTQRLLSEGAATLPSLSRLSQPMLAATVEAGTYQINRDNLKVALGDDFGGLSLDAIKAASASVYARVLKDLGGYLSVLEDNETTVESSSHFAEILNDLREHDKERQAEVVRRSADTCRVDDLTEVATSAWYTLAVNLRFPSSYGNVRAYVDQLSVDDALGRLLANAETISDVAEADETEKQQLAVAVLNATSSIPSADIRATLASTLGLASPLDVSLLSDLTGELLGRLIEESVLDDSAESFAALTASDCTGLAYAISRSANFHSFMTSDLLPSVCVQAVVTDDRVSSEVKDVVVEQSSDYASSASVTALRSIGDYALTRGKTVEFPEIVRFAQKGVAASVVTRLLLPYLGNCTFEHLTRVLTALGGEYAKLTQAKKRPKLPRSDANVAIVRRLDELGVVSSHEVGESEIKVNMKRSFR